VIPQQVQLAHQRLENLIREKQEEPRRCVRVHRRKNVAHLRAFQRVNDLRSAVHRRRDPPAEGFS
jgi:hypothetical protein